MSEQPSGPGAATSEDALREPPTHVMGILSRLGPGMIIAAAIVGSGELIATTKTGAEAGFTLLWLILLGCVIKVFAQVEFGRYTLVTGRTAMDGMNEVPGPRLRFNWLMWYWLLMFLFSLGQLGGIIGGVGQAMAMSAPITGDYNRLLDEQDAWDAKAKPIRSELEAGRTDALRSPNLVARTEARSQIKQEIAAKIGARPATSRDDKYWAAIITVLTAGMLIFGRYGFVQNASTIMVAAFTVMTVFNVVALQSQPEWAINWSDLWDGLKFQLPTLRDGSEITPLATALATFGIIGVGATELIAYPYWCLEKGYAKFTGPRDASNGWASTARGWMRVMRWDAWCSMIVYTFATISFYFLGATVLHRAGKNPDGSHMIRTLGQMYEPVFKEWAQLIFLVGAFAVLYSTFFVAIASHARTCADAMRVFRGVPAEERFYRRWTQIYCAIFPFIALVLYLLIEAPAQMVLASGLMQAIMLPMLAAAAIYFRYRRIDDRIRPSRLWDTMLWLSLAVLLVTGGWSALSTIFPQLKYASY